MCTKFIATLLAFAVFCLIASCIDTRPKDFDELKKFCNSNSEKKKNYKQIINDLKYFKYKIDTISSDTYVIIVPDEKKDSGTGWIGFYFAFKNNELIDCSEAAP